MQARPGTIARAREFVLVSVAGVALALFMTWPLALDLGHLGRTLANDADGEYSIWNVAWVARTIVVNPARLFDANIFFPHKATLAYSEANLLAGVIGVPAYWLTRNPWLTTNVVMLVAFASAYACGYLLLRHLCEDRRAAAVAAILYAFCPYVFSHLSHIQLLMTGGIPLSMLMVHRVADSFRLKAEATGTPPVASTAPPVASTDPSVASTDPSVASTFRWKALALGLALAAQALACAYYGVFAGLMVGFAALVLATTRRLWTSAAYWTSIAIAAATSLVLLLPIFFVFLRVQKETGFIRSIGEAARWSATPLDYIVSSAHAHAWLLDVAQRAGWHGEVLFPGILAILLGITGLAIAIRERHETAIIYGALGALAFWASFGPGAGLYRVLYELPTFSFLHAPSRMGLVVVFALSVFASIAIARLLQLVAERYRTLVAGIVAAAAIGELTVVPIRWYRAPALPTPYLALAKSPRGTVAEFPFYGERIAFPLHTQYMLFSTSHWMPLVNGYSDVIPGDFRQAAVVLDGFPSNDAFAVMARHRVRYIALHWDMWVGRQDEIRLRLEPYLPLLRTIAADDRMTLYEVMRYP